MPYENSFPKSLLSERNLKATAIRVEFLQLIRNYKTAMPFSMIQEALEESDRITLYRTIQTLLDKGIIHKAFTNNEDTYYALCGSNCTDKTHYHNHVHFSCTVCKSVSCEDLSQEVSISLPQFKIEKININLTGVCKNCVVPRLRSE